MKTKTGATANAGIKIGGLAGVVAFIILGLIPSWYLSGYGSIIALSYLSGGPVEPTLIMRALIVLGSVTGTFVAAATSIMASAALGMILGSIAEALSPAKAIEGAQEEAKQTNH